ncbi:NAD(P)-dependent alcohol dehydrogenase [Pseudolysinimonas kribbensis]|uniref:Sorbitol dehydrogenase n=1 Tax=Pseudolysinimonas kribbensis TaxID=433641 RepID=A0ABQ6K0I9_9MICO|nr:alcohol dehydrogenase catalytic domain-containing protein [Pseudolysinimonas kribbensis]GMA94110.1 sorbitol dehydrogenase [Pseudolysinimonas kribbensis]
MPNTAAVLTSAGVVELRNRPVPLPGEGEAIVRIRSVGVSELDVARFEGTWDRSPGWGAVLGHEATGEVVGVGAGVTMVGLGDRVAIEPGAPCRRCAACRRGCPRLCAQLAFFIPPLDDGFLVRYAAIDEWQLHRLPDLISFDDGVLIEPLAVALRAVERAALRAGDRVLVTGAGPMGLLAAEAARALGADTVRLADGSATRLDIASSRGFEVEDGGAGSEVDVLLECSGSVATLLRSIERLADGGRAVTVCVSASDDTVTVPRDDAREISVARANRYQFTWLLAVELASTARIELDGIVSHGFGMARAAEAFRLAAGTPDAMKVVIHPGDD